MVKGSFPLGEVHVEQSRIHTSQASTHSASYLRATVSQEISLAKGYCASQTACHGSFVLSKAVGYSSSVVVIALCIEEDIRISTSCR